MQRVPFTVSFDAMNTLIQVTCGLGYQYLTSYASFLQRHGIDLRSSCPNATSGMMHDAALKAISDQVLVDRAAWTRSADPKEMPIGGNTDEELRSFWTRVLKQTYNCATLYDGASPNVVRRVKALWSNHQEVERFMDYMLFDQFASSKAHNWCPEGLNTLQRLCEWNQKQTGREKGATPSSPRVATPAFASSSTDSTSSTPSPLFLATPPFVVTNADSRMRDVFSQLGAFDVGASGEPPLLAGIISARDVGYAKPSPAGILAGVRDAAASYRAACQSGGGGSEPGVDIRLHVHVGDADADRVACERAGCHYVQCDPVTGATWELLHAKLQELQASCRGG
ncbi:hypothetical protein JKF63_02602 [Porcisia hertigi]|uniref:Uncharacterized protein n=1 Tax=Porcisia hertigi TaxID=2761500 RepID=A0A836IF92_9TRYP|nr:hypothetical protein JKF63_02602 [Porcisia hertigi]